MVLFCPLEPNCSWYLPLRYTTAPRSIFQYVVEGKRMLVEYLDPIKEEDELELKEYEIGHFEAMPLNSDLTIVLLMTGLLTYNRAPIVPNEKISEIVPEDEPIRGWRRRLQLVKNFISRVSRSFVATLRR